MGKINLQREYLDDVTNQRFQENTDRMGKQIQKRLSDAMDTSDTNSSDLSALQAQVDALAAPTPPTPPLNLVYTKGEYHFFNVGAGFSGTRTIAHSLGIVPFGWWMIDHDAPAPPVYRVSWGTTTITLFIDNSLGSTLNYKLYLVA